MKLRDFFLLGIKAGLGKKRAWMNLLFNEVYNPTAEDRLYWPHFKDGRMFFYKEGDSNDVVEYIDDYIEGRAPLHFRDEFILQPGELLNYKGTEPLRTCYGNVFANQLCLVECFGDLFPFIAGYFLPSKLEDKILDLMIDDPDINDPAPPSFGTFRERQKELPMATGGKLYVWQYLKFCDHCLALPGYADGLVTSVTEKSMTSSPDRDKVRSALLEKHKDNLNDPAIVAKISDELIALDVAYLKDDDSYEFYDAKHAKLFGGVRKKVHYLFGGEAPFADGTTVELISKSLEEGIDTDHMPVMNNSLRYGSYNRGAQTALGGESTKTIYRMVGTVRIIEPDCKTWLGVPSVVTKFNATDLIGYSYIDNGQSVLIEANMLDQLMGKTLYIRGPATCKSGGKGKNICAVCAGRALAENPNGIPAAAAGVGGRFLSIFMSKMHSATLRTVHWDMHRRIT